MNKYLATALVGTVTVSGALVGYAFGGVNQLKEIEAKSKEMSEKIGTYENNETSLVEKITTMKEKKAELEKEIARLDVDSISNKAVIVVMKEEVKSLNEEITNLSAQLEQLDAAEREIARLNQEITKANELVASTHTYVMNLDSNNNHPLTENELSDILDQEKVSMLSDLKVSTAGQINATFKINEEINISVLKKGNVVVKYYNNEDQLVKTKAKHWSGYLNDSKGQKYGSGANDLRVIPAGTELSTALSMEDSSELNVKFVTVTVTNNEGNSMTLSSK
ncbi:MAG: hypothetical protein ACRCWQ_05470 [Bacilli bacterium]